MDRNTKINILSFVIVAGFGFAVAFHYVLGFYQGLPYPYNTFLFLPKAHFLDFFDVIRDSQGLNPYIGAKSAQYPFLIIIGYLFSLIPRNSFQIYLLLICIPFLIFNFAYFSKDHLFSGTNIFIITFLSYPFLFAMDRENFESLLFILLLVFMVFYTKKRYLASAIILSFAISMKIYPAILLVLFIPDKKYREAAICIAAAIAITIASLLCFKGGFLPNLLFLIQGANIGSNGIFTDFISIGNNMVQRGVSLLTLIKIFSIETGPLPAIIRNHFLTFYMGLAFFLGILVVLYVIFIEKEEWKRFAILIFAMLLLPPISADYKLLYIFIPLYIFINNKKPSKTEIIYLLMFCLLLIPKDYSFLPNVISDAPTYHDISISVVINIITMLLMSTIIMISSIGSYFSDLHNMTGKRVISLEITENET